MVKLKSVKNKKAQAWSIDLTIASVIFLLGIVIIYFYSINLSNEAEDTLNILLYEGNFIASNLLSQGHPNNWKEFTLPEDTDNITIPGILNEQGKIEEEKVKEFRNLDMVKIKRKFSTKYDFCFQISEEFEVYPGEGVCTSPPPPDEVENKIRITRFAIYKDKPVSFYVDIWN
jgi:hypothetical protein